MSNTPDRISRSSRLGWVRLDEMKINPQAQRDFDQKWAEELLSKFDPDKMAFIHVNHRDGWFYVMDGQHTRWAAMHWLGSDQQVQCLIYDGLTGEEEAEMYLSLNEKRPQKPVSKFKVHLTAGHTLQTDIDRIARLLDLRIGANANLGEITCVATLETVYKKCGPGSLRAVLEIIRDTYGREGFKTPIIKGLALAIDRYGNMLDVDQLTARLKTAGLTDLHRRGRALKQGTGSAMDQCYACAAVEFYNRGKGKKVNPWWKFQDVA